MNFTIQNADLETAVDFLKNLKARQIDVVAPVGRVEMVSGQIVCRYETTGGQTRAVVLQPTETALGQVAEKIGIPAAYLKKCIAKGPKIADENFNFWSTIEAAGENARNFLLRGFLDDDGTTGILRAFLSDRYKTIENLTLLGLTLESVLQSGVEIVADKIDVSENRMYASFSAPSVGVTAKDLLGNFSDPNGGKFGGLGRDNGINMGFIISNSETGQGKVELMPRIKILACANGLIYEETGEAFSRVHLGGKLGQGEQSEALKTIEIEYITQEIKEVLQQIVNKDYLGKRVKELRELKKAKISEPMVFIENLANAYSLAEDELDSIFGLFTAINQMADESPNLWHVSQAVTTWSHRQTADKKIAAEVIATPAGLLPIYEEN